MSQKLNAATAVIGIDIGKNSFHIVGHDHRGAIVLRQKWSRGQVETRLANLPPCLIGMEACVGAHHLSRKIQMLGHDARFYSCSSMLPASIRRGLQRRLSKPEAPRSVTGFADCRHFSESFSFDACTTVALMLRPSCVAISLVGIFPAKLLSLTLLASVHGRLGIRVTPPKCPSAQSGKLGKVPPVTATARRGIMRTARGLTAPWAGGLGRGYRRYAPSFGGRNMNDRRKIMEHPPFPLLDAAEVSSMNDFLGVDPIRAINLRWTLRDIKAKRTMFPVDPDHLRTLIELGLVEDEG